MKCMTLIIKLKIIGYYEKLLKFRSNHTYNILNNLLVVRRKLLIGT